MAFYPSYELQRKEENFYSNDHIVMTFVYLITSFMDMKKNYSELSEHIISQVLTVKNGIHLSGFMRISSSMANLPNPKFSGSPKTAGSDRTDLISAKISIHLAMW
ncbi:hypothetical protein CHS0354_035081 [Potamilus streckersoni]|uniref:Uncharacterized protein n=1 Tax=Potamilus streckersoni TaxID=2493646 RepID=A0AAE0RYA1_9BIVA|nr:hypothetical protein CHS0354_035081 [Potamilus streckersoni]